MTNVTTNAADAPATKIAQVAALLQRTCGAALDELTAATDWQPHSMRAALTGLRKKGHKITRTSRGGVSVYFMAN